MSKLSVGGFKKSVLGLEMCNPRALRGGLPSHHSICQEGYAHGAKPAGGSQLC